MWSSQAVCFGPQFAVVWFSLIFFFLSFLFIALEWRFPLTSKPSNELLKKSYTDRNRRQVFLSMFVISVKCLIANAAEKWQIFSSHSAPVPVPLCFAVTQLALLLNKKSLRCPHYLQSSCWDYFISCPTCMCTIEALISSRASSEEDSHLYASSIGVRSSHVWRGEDAAGCCCGRGHQTELAAPSAVVLLRGQELPHLLGKPVWSVLFILNKISCR